LLLRCRNFWGVGGVKSNGRETARARFKRGIVGYGHPGSSNLNCRRPLPAGLNFSSEVKAMIKGVHTMFYSSEPEAFRAFLKDKLGFRHTDIGHGWLLFDLPEADMGCHPADNIEKDGKPTGTHDISFYCDDVEKTVAELKEKGVEFTGEIENRGYGLVTFFKMPGNVQVQLYQPLYQKKFDS